MYCFISLLLMKVPCHRYFYPRTLVSIRPSFLACKFLLRFFFALRTISAAALFLPCHRHKSQRSSLYLLTLSEAFDGTSARIPTWTQLQTTKLHVIATSRTVQTRTQQLWLIIMTLYLHFFMRGIKVVFSATILFQRINAKETVFPLLAFFTAMDFT